MWQRRKLLHSFWLSQSSKLQSNLHERTLRLGPSSDVSADTRERTVLCVTLQSYGESFRIWRESTAWRWNWRFVHEIEKRNRRNRQNSIQSDAGFLFARWFFSVFKCQFQILTFLFFRQQSHFLNDRSKHGRNRDSYGVLQFQVLNQSSDLALVVSKGPSRVHWNWVYGAQHIC